MMDGNIAVELHFVALLYKYSFSSKLKNKERHFGDFSVIFIWFNFITMFFHYRKCLFLFSGA